MAPRSSNRRGAPAAFLTAATAATAATAVLCAAAAASCDARGSDGTAPAAAEGGSPATQQPRLVPAAPGDAAGPVDEACMHARSIHAGGAMHGTTCGGPLRPFGESVCEKTDHPVAYVRVDAPAGASVRVDATTSVALLGLGDCANPPLECTALGTSLAPRDPGVRLFAVQRTDVPCGEFTISAAQP